MLYLGLRDATGGYSYCMKSGTMLESCILMLCSVIKSTVVFHHSCCIYWDHYVT